MFSANAIYLLHIINVRILKLSKIAIHAIRNVFLFVCESKSTPTIGDGKSESRSYMLLEYSKMYRLLTRCITIQTNTG